MKISVSVDASLVDAIDRDIRKQRFPSRSAAIAEALKEWARKHRDTEIDAYYAALEGDDQREDEEWGDYSWKNFVDSERGSRAAESPAKYGKRTSGKSR